VKVEPEVKLSRTEMHLVGWMDVMWVYGEKKKNTQLQELSGLKPVGLVIRNVRSR